MRSLLLALLLPAFAAIVASLPAAAHGGSYTGPITPPGKQAPVPPFPAGPGGPGPITPGSDPDPQDLTQWQYWWAFNQAPYLRLQSHVRSGGAVTGSDEYRLGKGSTDPAEGLRVSASTIRGVILPELLQALRKESSNDIQSSCMIALAKIGDPDDPTGSSLLSREIQREIARRLVSPNQELAETAAVALGITGHRANIAFLTAVLENDLPGLRALDLPVRENVSTRTRAFAACGLGLIGNRAGEYDRLVIVATLRKLLDGEARSMAQRDVPAACLTAIGLTPLPVDKHDFVDRNPRKEQLSGALVSRQDELLFLLGFWADESQPELTRAQVPTSLARLLSTDDAAPDLALRSTVVKEFLKTLDDPRADVAMQQSCILALGAIGDCDEDPLDTAIRTKLMHMRSLLTDQQARRFALIALAQAAGRPGTTGDPLCGVNTRDSEENARRFLVGELSSRTQMRAWAGLALAILERSLADAQQPSSSDSRLALRTCLREARTPDDLGAFAIACGIAQELGAKEILLEHLGSVRDVEARGMTAIALGLLDEQAAVAPLEAIVKASKFQPDLLRNAAIALGLLDDKRIVPELVTMLAAATSLSSQAAICKALGTIGDSRSVDALVRLLNDQLVTDLARAFGAVALGIVADKEDLPWNAKIGVGANYRANTSSLTDGKGGILDIL
ncbi:MAG TPA: HEAT repeat domain-containing protein [Planctomycetota bacterium]|nr:HEAT repeat domain-containing protein [Planctomycetota bacterium]